MEFTKLPDFAVERTNIEFTGFWDWFVKYNDFYTLWQAQPSYIYLQLLVLIGSAVTLYHAIKNGGRFLHLWIGIILHGLVIETISYNLPDIDNFWHSQTPIIFLGGRLPLHIIVIYAVFLYTATISVDKLNLPRWSEPFAVGLVAVLIDYPYDIIGIRFMQWTWHDTDPNISDKHYHVPWNSFYFHATFAASFNFWFHYTRRVVFRNNKKWISSGSFLKECGCSMLAVLLGMPGGILLFIPLYHPLHDVYKIHSEVTYFFILAIFFSIIWLSFPRTLESVTNSTNKTTNIVMFLYMLFYYLFFIGIAAFIDPASEVSIGWHEPIGPCDEKTAIKTALGHTLQKRKYLCITDNDETYFNWNCLPNGKPPKDGARWYTICGAAFTNRVEYIVILSAIAVFGVSFFVKTLCHNDKLKYHKEGSVKGKDKVKSN